MNKSEHDRGVLSYRGSCALAVLFVTFLDNKRKSWGEKNREKNNIMAKVKVVFLLASMASMASAGCRYANPQWDMTQMSLSAPSIQVALTEQVDKIVAKWNESLISQKSQCVDKINLFADDVMLCSVAPLQQRCESASELTCGTDNLNTVR